MHATTKERRAHTRLPLVLEANISASGSDARPCQIRDFCPGGLFLAIPRDLDELSLGGHSISQGDDVVISYTADSESGIDLTFCVNARVARVFGRRMGVEFHDREADGVRVLNTLAHEHQRKRKQQQHEYREPRSSGGGSSIPTFISTVLRFLTTQMEHVFEKANDSLFEVAKKAPSNTEQNACFDAMKEIDVMSTGARQRFLELISAHLDQLARGQVNFAFGAHATQEGELEFSLVDEDVFDDWLTIKNIVSKAESQHLDVLYDLHQRLSYATGLAIDEESNPISANGLCFTFHDAMQEQSASRKARRAVLGAFEAHIVAELGVLYRDVNDALIECGILPVVEKPKRAARAAPPPANNRFTQAHTGDPSAGHVDAEHVAERSSAANHNTAHYPPMSGQPYPPAAPPPYAPSQFAEHTPAHPATGAFDTARSLLALMRSLPGSAPPPDTGSTSGRSPWRTQELVDRITQLQRSPQMANQFGEQSGQLKSRLFDALGDNANRIDPVSRDAVDVVSNLFDAISEDPQITEGVKRRIQQLALPLLKVAISDAGFLTNTQHPARQFLNVLGTVGHEQHAIVDPVIENVLGRYDQDNRVFEDAISEVDNALAERNRTYEERVKRIVEQQEQQQALMKERTGAKKHSPASSGRTTSVEWSRWLAKARQLCVGDAVLSQNDANRAEMLRAIWVDDERDTFVLTDEDGEKVTTLTAQELALSLCREEFTVQKDADLPVIDRNIHRMLGSMHQKLSHMSMHDELTGLLNRREFEARLVRALTLSWRKQQCHVMCLIDINGFAAINRKCGEAAGNELLKKIGMLLQLQPQPDQSTARLNADKFAVLVENCGPEDALRLANEYCTNVAKPRFVWEGTEYPLSASVGAVCIDDNFADTDEIMNAAEDAIAKAKANGSGTMYLKPKSRDVSDPESGAEDNASSNEGNNTAIELTNLRLRCQRVQPIGPDDENAKPHYEILLGVSDDKGKLIDPTQFILAAERENKMIDVDRWVIRNAFLWMAKNRKQLLRVAGYSINLSGTSLDDPTLLEYVIEQFSETKVPPAKVVFELTETAAIESEATAIEFMRTIKEYGCKFSLDDFGTGHATYSYLRTFPVDYVKIDGLFVRDLTNNPNDLAMVKSINDIGQFMGKKTIAEYVENEETLTLLKTLGVDYAQGYGVEKPMLLSDQVAM